MSGVPLPAPELPNATVTVRLVRERMGNNCPASEVTLVTPDGRGHRGDRRARAARSSRPCRPGRGSPPRSSSTARRSARRSSPCRRPAACAWRWSPAWPRRRRPTPPPGRPRPRRRPARARSCSARDTRIILEFQDDKPTFFYLFSVVNNARTPVDTGHAAGARPAARRRGRVAGLGPAHDCPDAGSAGSR